MVGRYSTCCRRPIVSKLAQIPPGRAECPTVDSSDSFLSFPALSLAISAMACSKVSVSLAIQRSYC